MGTRFSLAELQDLEVISSSQADNLLIDDGVIRVWLCRCGVEDGMPYDNGVTVEHCQDGRWVTISEYEAV